MSAGTPMASCDAPASASRQGSKVVRTGGVLDAVFFPGLVKQGHGAAGEEVEKGARTGVGFAGDAFRIMAGQAAVACPGNP